MFGTGRFLPIKNGISKLEELLGLIERIAVMGSIQILTLHILAYYD
jgi:hypothetical protein